MPRAPIEYGNPAPRDTGLPAYAIPRKAVPYTTASGATKKGTWLQGGVPTGRKNLKGKVKAAAKAAIKPKGKGGKGSPKGSSSTYKPGVKKGTASKGGKGGGGGKKTTSKTTTTKKTTATKASTTNYTDIAKKAVAAELDPKLSAISAEQAAYDKKAAQQQKDTRERGKQVTHDIGFLYENLDTNLAAKNAETQTAYGTAQQTVDQNYAQLLQKLTGNTTASVDKVNAEAERLGLAPPVESRAQADGNFMSQLAEVNRTNAAVMIGAQKQNAANTGGFIQSAEKGLGVQTSADFQTGNERALNEMTRTQLEQDAKFGSQKSILEQQRSSMEREYMQQLEQQAYDRAQEAKQQQFMNSLALGKFNLSQDTFAANQEYRKAQLELDRIKIQQAAQKATGDKAAEGFDLNSGINYIDANGGSNKDTLLQTFNTARTAGEVNFNDPKKRNEIIQVMRNWLSMNYPQLNTGENMTLLANALDKYHRTVT